MSVLKDNQIESLKKEVKRLKTEIAAIENRLRVVDYTAPQFLKDLRKTARQSDKRRKTTSPRNPAIAGGAKHGECFVGNVSLGVGF